MKFPIYIEGLDKTVQINSNDIRQNPQMAAKNWLNMEGFNVRGKESKYIELVAGLSKHLIQKYKEYISAKKTIDGNKSAKSKAPCIVFIDEIDSIGRQRGAGIGGTTNIVRSWRKRSKKTKLCWKNGRGC